MQIVAFDIGIHNLAWCLVEFPQTCSMEKPLVEECIRSVLNVRSMDLWDSFSFTFNANDLTLKERCHRLFLYLSSFDSLWKQIDVLLIEKQMITRQHLNVQAFKMSQHILSYFVINHPSIPILLEYPAAFKSKLLFQESLTSGYQRKQWAIQKTKWFLENDPVALDWFLSYPKLDDIADSLLMCIVYYYSHYVKRNRKNHV